MVFGDTKIFAIECYNESFNTAGHHVFGRMCVWIYSTMLGNIQEPSCMLNVTERSIRDSIDVLALEVPFELSVLDETLIFQFLSDKLFSDQESIEQKTMNQILSDSKLYGKFNYLTNGGESFDFFRSFIVPKDDSVVISFEDADLAKKHFKIKKSNFISVSKEFLEWLRTQKDRKNV